jgi:hypothetical protein
MDLSQLKSLGEVAGIGGIALGVVVLLVRPLIDTIAGLPESARAGTVKWIAVGCFAIGALGIACLDTGSRSSVSTSGGQSPAGRSATGMQQLQRIHRGQPSAGRNLQAGPPERNGKHERNQSPGVISGGNVQIQYPTSPPAATPPSPQ